MQFLASLRAWVDDFTASRNASQCVPSERILAFTSELDEGGLLTRFARAEKDAISRLGVIGRELYAIEMTLDDTCECKTALHELRQQLESLVVADDSSSGQPTGERESLASGIVSSRVACRCVKFQLDQTS